MMSKKSSLWPESAYRLDVPRIDSVDLSLLVDQLHRRVWRTSLDEPGFALIRFSGVVDSRDLRNMMLGIMDALPARFVPERLGRFDQQVSSRFHRDGAPNASLLLLGYEASMVRSRVFLADAHRAALVEELLIAEYLARNNPMFAAGEAKLAPFVTEIAIPHGESCIIAVNNSLMQFGGTNPLGVLHKAEVPQPDSKATRVINSMGLMLADDPTGTPKSSAEIEHFLRREDLD